MWTRKTGCVRPMLCFEGRVERLFSRNGFAPSLLLCSRAGPAMATAGSGARFFCLARRDGSGPFSLRHTLRCPLTRAGFVDEMAKKMVANMQRWIPVLAAVLWFAFTAPAWGQGNDLSYIDEAIPREEQVLRFLQWYEAEAKEKGVAFADLKKEYAQSAAYAAVYSECLTEKGSRKAGKHTAMARFLYEATSRLTDGQTAARDVGDEYGKIKKLTENCEKLTGLEGNYDFVYFAKVKAMDAAFFFELKAENTVPPDTRQTSPRDGASPAPDPKGRENTLPEANEADRERAQFLEWEKQRVKGWGMTVADLEKEYVQSAAYALVCAECLAEQVPKKAKDIRNIAKILLAMNVQLTDKPTTEREVTDEYWKIHALTENCQKLTGLEGNYDLIYSARILTLGAVFLFEPEPPFLPEYVGWLLVIAITVIYILMYTYNWNQRVVAWMIRVLTRMIWALPQVAPPKNAKTEQVREDRHGNGHGQK